MWLWDVRDPGHPVPEAGPLTGASGYVQAVAFSPDGRLLAAGSADDRRCGCGMWPTRPGHGAPPSR